jgi:DNA-binding MarR family transcriptional regulator/GNAT superfamily N-acetyltransferase
MHPCCRVHAGCAATGTAYLSRLPGGSSAGYPTRGILLPMSTSSVLSATTRSTAEERVAAVRRFNRFYTNVLGLLQEGLLETPYSLTEARVIFELAAAGGPVDTSGLRRQLDIDPGYLSRVLAQLQQAGLITRQQSPADGRRQLVGLAGPGREAFRLLDQRSACQIHDLLSPLPESRQQDLTSAMSRVQNILAGPAQARPAAYVLRSPGPGDLGWVVRQHGVMYADEYHFDAGFEALVARIVADYANDHDPRREAAWIAEVNGEPAGCVFCVRKDDSTAQLRLLLVDPAARGLGIGARLVSECVSFARRAGYAELVLWTNDILTAARHVYQAAGFQLVDEERHHSFGHDLTGQTWRLTL